MPILYIPNSKFKYEAVKVWDVMSVQIQMSNNLTSNANGDKNFLDCLMNMELICRTCLKTNLYSTKYFKIVNNIEENQMSIKDMLEIFMPEMDLDIFEEEIVMCTECSEALKNAYFFKNRCLKTEEKIYDYLHHYNIKLGRKISLNNVLKHKISSSETDLIESKTEFKISPLPNSITVNDSNIDTKPLKENIGNSDSNQSSCEIFNSDATVGNQVQSENEAKKEVLKTPRTRKRKRANNSNKKKNYDYSSLKRNYTCDQCEYKAYRLDLLKTHKQKHDKNMLNVKEYKCDLCMYSTLRKRALDRHLFTHKGKSKHLCEICNKPFAEKYQLKLHLLTHTGEELPHKCKLCGKGYLTNSYLKQHMETRHLTNEKQTCQECPQENCDHSFIRYYRCTMCRSSFSDKRGLDAHKFTHTGGELPYKCLHCNFSTAWKGNLKKHLQNKH